VGIAWSCRRSKLRVACSSEQVVTLPAGAQYGAADSVVAFVSGVARLDHARALDYCRQFLPSYIAATAVRIAGDAANR
jgi:hypothetical protein